MHAFDYLRVSCSCPVYYLLVHTTHCPLPGIIGAHRKTAVNVRLTNIPLIKTSPVQDFRPEKGGGCSLLGRLIFDNGRTKDDAQETGRN